MSLKDIQPYNSRLVLLICEVKHATTDDDVQQRLDEFRETELPSQRWNLTICRAYGEDLQRFGISVLGNAIVESVEGHL